MSRLGHWLKVTGDKGLQVSSLGDEVDGVRTPEGEDSRGEPQMEEITPFGHVGFEVIWGTLRQDVH